MKVQATDWIHGKSFLSSQMMYIEWPPKYSSLVMNSSPMPGHGLLLKWTRLQRLFSRLPIHFLHCLGFKLGGFFPRLFRILCIGCVNSFLSCLILFVSYLDWFLGCQSFFFGCLHFLVVYMCSFVGTLGCLGIILDYLGLFISILGFFIGILSF